MKKNKLISYLYYVLITLGIFSCSSHDKEIKGFKVEYRGALKNAMFGSDLSAKSDLFELKGIDNLYALGATENLKGEIQIFDSKPYNTIVTDSGLVFDHSFKKKATLLVYVTVKSWRTIDIPDSILSYQQLEKYIEITANNYQINTDEPLPFMLTGTVQSFAWHVINWPEGDTKHTHKKHRTSGLYGTEKGRLVELLGFYSNNHHGIFTHHTTNMHLHVKTTDNELAGHIDDLTLASGMKLLLPEMSY